MTSASSLFRSLLIYGLCLPLAVLLGYQMASPLDFTTFIMVGMVLFLLMIPLLLRWHFVWLIASWNMCVVLFFLPGQPQVGMVLAWLSLMISVVQYILNRKLRFLHVPTVVRPLIFLAVVVLITAACTGGIGLRVFGSQTVGGKKYLMLITAIVGYFALTAQHMPPQRAGLYVALFFLGFATQGVGDLVSLVNPFFYFIFLIFPVSNWAGFPNEPVARTIMIARPGGLAMVGSAVFCALLSRYGIQELFSWRRAGRLLMLLAFAGVGMMGGFRSMVIQFLLIFAALFYLEGLMRSRLLPALTLLAVLCCAVLAPFTDRLPLNIQRSLSFLPLPIDPIARLDAQGSNEWRLDIWRHVWPQVPHYLLLGKGYSYDANDVPLLLAMARTSETAGDQAEMAGDYHNGPLSVIMSFGIFGVIGFVWFMAAALRVLYQNYHFGDPAHRRLNTFLLAYFVARTIAFISVFGSFYSELACFTGLVGLSISLNGGVAKPAVVPQPVPVLGDLELEPAYARKSLGVN